MRPTHLKKTSSALLLLATAVLGSDSTPTFPDLPGSKGITGSKGTLTGTHLVTSVSALFDQPGDREPTLSVGGTPRRIVDSSPIARSQGGPGWRSVLFVDPVLAEGGVLTRMAEWLGAEADELAALGTLEVQVADPFVETWLEPSTDPEEMVDTLDWVVEELEPWDQEGDHGRGVALEPAELAERVLELVGWLSLQEGAGARVLWLPISSETWQVWAAESPEAGSWLAPAAALGWTVVPIALESSAERLAALDRMASTTGGRAVSDAGSLARTLSSLTNARSLSLQLSSPDFDAPRSLEVSGSSRGGVRVPAWISVAAPEPVIKLRTRRFLESGGRNPGSMPVVSAVVAGSATEGWGGGTLEVMVTLPGGRGRRTTSGAGPVFAVSALVVRVGGEESLIREVVQPEGLAGREAWLYKRSLDDFGSIDGVAVTVEELIAGTWGLSVAELSAVSLDDLPGGIAVHSDIPDMAEPSPSQQRRAPEISAIRVLPPKKRPVEGPTRFQTLLSDMIVARVEFYLDGKLMDADDNGPFSATLDLGPKPRNRVVRVVAYDRQDRRIGEDSLTINPLDIPFAVRITELEGQPELGQVDVAGDVSVPEDARLERVEFYWNESLQSTLDSPPWRARITSEAPGLNDYVRMVAYLADGNSTEDARLLSERGLIERVEVNLVQLNVVVSDRNGNPVRDLQAENFEVRFAGEPRPIERFSLAEEVPLLLGLLVDTSGSMQVLMNDTKKAGARFLSDSLRLGDRAFLVDFDTRPRLVHPITGDLVSLMNRFVQLEAEGNTALYDAVIFSLLQFEEEKGRKALVMLTDGFDYGSKYGPRRCISYGRRLGVPIYILSLAGMQHPRGGIKRLDLESLTETTGGRAFYITDTAQLADAYARINDELRSQYVLTFSTERPLEEEELDKIQVKLDQKGYRVRAVVGSQQVD